MGQRAVIMMEMCGRLADRDGALVQLSIPADGCVAADVLALAGEQFDLADEIARGRIRLCVNEAIARSDSFVSPRDRVALFPPVSGG